jgi:hypothetical protein
VRIPTTDYGDKVRPVVDVKSSYQFNGVAYFQDMFLELFFVLRDEFYERKEILDMPS